MTSRRNGDEAHREAVARAVGFSVTRFLGRGSWESVGDYQTLEAARCARDGLGRDDCGRRPMIYALVPGRSGIFVE